MSAEWDIISFDGHNSGTDYRMYFSSKDAQWQYEASLSWNERRNTTPELDTSSHAAVKLSPLHIKRPGGSAVSSATFRKNVMAWFSRDRNRLGVRYLRQYRHDGSALRDVRIGCYVTSVTLDVNNDPDHIIVTMQAASVWEDNAATTDTNPVSITNAGNEATHPIIEMTTGTHKSMRHITVTGIDAISYPIRVALSDAGLSTTNMFAYVQGVNVPCYVDTNGAGTYWIWFLCDIAADANTDVWIVWGSGLTNPQAGLLDSGGMDWTLLGCDNTDWYWSDVSVSGQPGHIGAWQLAVTGNNGGVSGGSYELHAEGASTLIFERYTDGTGAGDGDSSVLIVPSGVSSLANVRRITTNHTSGVRSYVRYWQQGKQKPTTAWSTTADGTVTTSISMTNAIRVAIGVEYTSSTPTTNATLQVDTNPGDWHAVLANPPTVTLGAVQNLDYYNGNLQIGSAETFTFDKVLVIDGTLTIDTEARTFTPGDTSMPPLGLPDHDPDVWLSLEPGAQAVTNTTGASIDVTYRSGWS